MATTRKLPTLTRYGRVKAAKEEEAPAGGAQAAGLVLFGRRVPEQWHHRPRPPLRSSVAAKNRVMDG